MSYCMTNIRSWSSRLILLALAASPALADEASVMVLEGIATGPRDNGDFTIFDHRLAWDPARMEEWKKTAKPGERAPAEALGAIAQARIGPDKKFRLEIPVDKPRRVYFAIVNAKTPSGGTYGPVRMGNNFILERGELNLQIMRGNYWVITGGYYNDAIHSSWRLSDEFRKAQADYERFSAHVEDEIEEARRRRVDNLGEASRRLGQIEMQGMSRVALTHPDPMVRRFAIEASWSFGPWVLVASRALAKLTPEDPWAIKNLAGWEKAFDPELQPKLLGAGDRIIDFAGETLDGEAVRTADLRADNHYLLVEFWASWCGPCRAEIPHMKKAYARFRDKGLEIVSFTVDEEREDWVEASEEEELPWHNLGMGWEAEAPLAYNARTEGLPSNFLVNSRTGEIVAKDLRQHKLDEKLEELLD